MTPQRILHLNALSTAACALAMLGARSVLPPHLGLASPLLVDALAVGLLAYAWALFAAGRQPVVGRRVLLAFSAADAAWVLGSATVLLLGWGELSVAGRALVAAVAVVVEGFAAAQYLAARRAPALA